MEKWLRSPKSKKCFSWEGLALVRLLCAQLFLQITWREMPTESLLLWMWPSQECGFWETSCLVCGIVEVKTFLWSSSFRVRGSIFSKMLKSSFTCLMWPAKTLMGVTCNSSKTVSTLSQNFPQKQEFFASSIKWICWVKMWEIKLSRSVKWTFCKKWTKDSK